MKCGALADASLSAPPFGCSPWGMLRLGVSLPFLFASYAPPPVVAAGGITREPRAGSAYLHRIRERVFAPNRGGGGPLVALGRGWSRVGKGARGQGGGVGVECRGLM